MATTVFQGNATVNITQGVTSYDLSDQTTTATLTVGKDALEVTAFGDTGHIFVGGLQTVEVTLSMFLSYGTGEVETGLAAMVGQGNTTIVISPSGTTESASNPEYTITNAMLASFTPINSVVGELARVDAVFTGGTWARDITNP